MDVKQEAFDSSEFIKTEPEFSWDQKEGNYEFSTKHEAFNNDEFVLGAINNSCDFEITRQDANFDEFKQNIIECELPKIENHPDFLNKIEYNSILENVDKYPITVKEEVKSEIGDIKPMICEQYQFKDESELLTSHFEMPTLKDEVADYSNSESSSKNTGRNLFKRKKMKYLWLVCQKNYRSSRSRSNQIVGHFKKHLLICKFCGKLFKEKFEFWGHCFIHSVNDKKRRKVSKKNESDDTKMLTVKPDKHFECESCSRQFVRKKDLISHLKRCTERFKCDFCFKKFRFRSKLKLHLTSHSIERQFKCYICSKEFKHKASLQNHFIIHFAEQALKCDICSKEFGSKTYLECHVKTHTSGRSFKCDICSKEYFYKKHLKYHVRTHKNERPFQCDLCSKEFIYKSYLQYHVKTHTNERPFKCDTCSKDFISNTHLQCHIKTHTNERPFKCDICLKAFTQKSTLQRHLKIHSNLF